MAICNNCMFLDKGNNVTILGDFCVLFEAVIHQPELDKPCDLFKSKEITDVH